MKSISKSFFIFVLSISLCSCSNSDQKKQLDAQELQNVDYYNAFYFKKIVEILSVSGSPNCISDLIKYVDNPESLFDNNKFDNLSNIYYILSLLPQEKIHENSLFQNKIKDYLDRLQTNLGSFGFSNKHRNEINDSKEEGHETYLSTYYAVESYKLIGKRIDDEQRNKLNRWINNKFSSLEFWNSIDISTAGYLVTLLKISESINYDLYSNNKLISKKVTQLVSEITKYQNKNQLTLIDVFNVYEISQYIGGEVIDPTSFKNMILEYQKPDGGFSVTTEDDSSNIMTTYLAVSMLEEQNQEIPKLDVLKKSVLTFGIKKICTQ